MGTRVGPPHAHLPLPRPQQDGRYPAEADRLQRTAAPWFWLAGGRLPSSWRPEERKRFLLLVANNCRFLVLPWVRVPNLASHALARFIEALQRDWPAKYGCSLLLLETTWIPYFSGTLYRAANWILVGQTKGFIKHGRGYRYHGHPKEVYVYPLVPDFRDIIGCVALPPKRHFTMFEGRGAMLFYTHD
ncbi:MAG: Druantia anti-phage system protein DruA [Bacillota bacterium]